MPSSNGVIFVLATLLSLVGRCISIQCYYCNSADNSACLDVKMDGADMIPDLVPIVDCRNAIPGPVSAEFFCRKIVQTIFHTHKTSEVRVTRGCGWVAHPEPCYRADSGDHLETACQCFTDFCNSGDSLDPGTATALFVALAACLYFYR